MDCATDYKKDCPLINLPASAAIDLANFRPSKALVKQNTSQ